MYTGLEQQCMREYSFLGELPDQTIGADCPGLLKT